MNCSRKGSAQILRIAGFMSSMPGAFEGFRDEIASNISDASMTIELNWSVGEGRLSIGGRMKSLVVNTDLNAYSLYNYVEERCFDMRVNNRLGIVNDWIKRGFWVRQFPKV